MVEPEMDSRDPGPEMAWDGMGLDTLLPSHPIPSYSHPVLLTVINEITLNDLVIWTQWALQKILEGRGTLP